MLRTIRIAAVALFLAVPGVASTGAAGQDGARIAELSARPVLTGSEQEELAKALFSLMAEDTSGDPAFYEKHYGLVMDKCPDTSRAHEAYWRLTNLYLRAYDEPRHDQVVRILEQFLSRYRTSDVVSMQKYGDGILVFSPLRYLHQSYEALGRYDRIAAYYDTVAGQESSLSAYDCFDYAQALDEVKRPKDAITWYEKFLKESEGHGNVDFMREVAADRLAELRAGRQADAA